MSSAVPASAPTLPGPTDAEKPRKRGASLEYRGRGRWGNPAFAERVYLILSLVAKSALAWQVYAGALAGG